MKHTSGNYDTKTPDEAADIESGGMSRRDFLKTSAAGVAAGAVGADMLGNLARAAGGEDGPNVPDGTGRVLIHGGIVLSLDPAVGDFEEADVLIEGKKIVEVAPNLKKQNPDAFKIDAKGMIVMPGFISTHHHQFYTIQRNIIADGFIVFVGSGAWPKEAYGSVAGNIWNAGRIANPNVPGTFVWDLGRPSYDPEDNYLSELVASLSGITQGLTCSTDTSQASHTPEYTDALIQGLLDSGRRTLFDYSGGTNRSAQFPDQPYEHPGRMGDETVGIGRLRKEWFPTDDMLVTLGLNSGPGQLPGTDYTGWQLARSFGAYINNHNVGAPQTVINAAADPRNGDDWSDVTLVHCVRWQDNPVAQISYDPVTNKSTAWEIFVAKGGHASIASIIEPQMQHGMPPFQMCLNHGVLPSLSPDVDTNMTPDPFSLMRGAFCLQRGLANDLIFPISNPDGLPVPQAITCREVLEMMTVAGAAGSGLLHKVGTLTPGKEADIVMLDTNNINIAPVNNAPGTVVTFMDTHHVRHVMIAGAIKYWKGQLVGWDTGKLVRDVIAARDKVLARINGPALVGSIPPGNNSFSNPYRPNFLGSCCYNGQNTTAPHYVLRP